MSLESQLRQFLRDTKLSRYRLSKLLHMPQSMVDRFLAGGGIYFRTACVMAEKLNLRLVQDAIPFYNPRRVGRPRNSETKP